MAVSRKPVVIEFRGQRGSGPDALMQVRTGRLRGLHAIHLGSNGKPEHMGRATFTSYYLTKDRPKGERRFSQAVVLDIHPPAESTESTEAVRRFRRWKDKGE